MENKELHLYEYSVIQYIPDIERGEFVNIGLIMMCKRLKWVKFKTELNIARISSFFENTDIDTLRNQLTGFEKIVNRKVQDIPVLNDLEAEERFRWLTAVRSASIQTTRPHCGLADDLEETFKRLFLKLVSM